MRPRNVTRIATWIFPLVVCSMWLLASASAASDDEDVPQFGPWSASVNIGPTVNSEFEDLEPFVSKDGLSLYFQSRGRPDGYGGYDIYVSQRASVDDAWGPPQNLGPTINTTSNEGNPALSIDGHRLYFNSNRPEGFGSNDIYVSRRHNKRDDFGWQTPVNLGDGVNSSANENQAFIFEDDETGVITLYFTSDRSGGTGNDIYTSTLQPDETFGQAWPVLELNTASEEGSVTIRRDGLELIFLSNRPGSILNPVGAPSRDLWTSTRASTSDPWSPPENVDPFGAKYINTGMHEGGPALSFDGTILYFFAARRPENTGPGCATRATTCLFDIWVTTRTKLKQPD